MTSITIENLYKDYGAVTVLHDVSLEIETGEFVVFVGPSGCGKSTLLRCISGLEGVSEGTIRLDGTVINDMAPAERGIAMVFQSYALYPHMTVAQNIAYPLRIAGAPKAEQQRRTAEVAARLHLEALLDRTPGALSGGQRQRVAIGRAIIRDPKVFLFDEPLSNLDAALRVQMRLELAGLKAQLPDTTMIYVTHDQVEAMTMADKIVVLRDGVVEQVGAPLELYEHPANDFVAGFIGSPRINFLDGALARGYGAERIGIRPEHVTLAPEGPWRGSVNYVERLGSDSYLYLTLADGTPMTVREEGTCRVATGDSVSVAPKGTVHRFGADGGALKDVAGAA